MNGCKWAQGSACRNALNCMRACICFTSAAAAAAAAAAATVPLAATAKADGKRKTVHKRLALTRQLDLLIGVAGNLAVLHRHGRLRCVVLLYSRLLYIDLRLFNVRQGSRHFATQSSVPLAFCTLPDTYPAACHSCRKPTPFVRQSHQGKLQSSLSNTTEINHSDMCLCLPRPVRGRLQF